MNALTYALYAFSGCIEHGELRDLAGRHSALGLKCGPFLHHGPAAAAATLHARALGAISRPGW
jgi:hypothetical protein